MQITAFLDKENIRLNQLAMEKKALLAAMIQDLAASGVLTDADACLDAVLAREMQCSTGVGHGIAIPHCKGVGVAHTAIGVVTVPNGMDYEALDGNPVQLIFLIVTQEGSEQDHVEVLARLSRLLLLPEISQKLLAATDADAFLEAVQAGEALLLEEEQELERQRMERVAAQNSYTVLAVTGCPTGIAHTYMAAQALEQAAEDLGMAVKVETNGAAGVGNPLTAEEIARCKGILVASDRAVEMERFAGRPVLRVSVAKAIMRPKMLLRKVAEGKAPIYAGNENAASMEIEAGKGRWWEAGYRHWMNGMSKILPLLMAAGVLGTLANWLPEQMGLPLFQISAAAQALVLVVLTGFIAQSMAGETGLAIGCMMGLLVQTGVSVLGWSMPGFVGAVLAGFVSGGVLWLLQRLLCRLPAPMAGLKPMLFYPVLGAVLAGLLTMVLNVPATLVFGALYNGWQAMPLWACGLFGGLLGGLMAWDLGGPVNKVAYSLAVLMLTAQQTSLMAAVMAAGMVPPLAASLAAWMAQDRFTQAEKSGAKSNMLLGLCFVSEAAQPLAAIEPVCVKPALVIGSALTACLSVWLGCGSPVPHGGIFVTPLMDNSVAWLAALAAGTLVSAVLLIWRLPKLEKADTTQE